MAILQGTHAILPTRLSRLTVCSSPSARWSAPFPSRFSASLQGGFPISPLFAPWPPMHGSRLFGLAPFRWAWSCLGVGLREDLRAGFRPGSPLGALSRGMCRICCWGGLSSTRARLRNACSCASGDECLRSPRRVSSPIRGAVACVFEAVSTSYELRLLSLLRGAQRMIARGLQRLRMRGAIGAPLCVFPIFAAIAGDCVGAFRGVCGLSGGYHASRLKAAL